VGKINKNGGNTKMTRKASDSDDDLYENDISAPAGSDETKRTGPDATYENKNGETQK